MKMFKKILIFLLIITLAGCFFDGDSSSSNSSDGGDGTVGETPEETKRSQHSATMVEDSRGEKKMYAFGGESDEGISNELWKYSFDDTRDGEESSTGPSARYNHTAVVVGNKMIIFGGKDKDGNDLKDVWEYDFDKKVWRKRMK